MTYRPGHIVVRETRRAVAAHDTLRGQGPLLPPMPCPEGYGRIFADDPLGRPVTVSVDDHLIDDHGYPIRKGR